MDLDNFISGATVGKLSKKVKADPAQVGKLLQAALPQLVKDMSKNASTKKGASALAKALEDHSGSGATAGLQNVDPVDGAKILKHIMGGKSGTKIQSLSKKAGLTSSQTSTVLSMVAPLLMNALGNHTQQSGTNAGGLAGMLGSLFGGGGGGGGSSSSGNLLGSLTGSLLSGGSQSSGGGGGILGNLLGGLFSSNAGGDDDSDDDDNDDGGGLGDMLMGLLSGKK